MFHLPQGFGNLILSGVKTYFVGVVITAILCPLIVWKIINWWKMKKKIKFLDYSVVSKGTSSGNPTLATRTQIVISFCNNCQNTILLNKKSFFKTFSGYKSIELPEFRIAGGEERELKSGDDAKAYFDITDKLIKGSDIEKVVLIDSTNDSYTGYFYKGEFVGPMMYKGKIVSRRSVKLWLFLLKNKIKN